MSTPKKIVLLPGDGIGELVASRVLRNETSHFFTGPEVVAEAERVINAVVKAFPSIKWEITSHPFGGAAMDLTGDPLPDSTFKACKEADAVLMGEFSYTPTSESYLVAEQSRITFQAPSAVPNGAGVQFAPN
jgi:isocitrate/isopropylmalate dehydrogenase